MAAWLRLGFGGLLGLGVACSASGNGAGSGGGANAGGVGGSSAVGGSAGDASSTGGSTAGTGSSASGGAAGASTDACGDGQDNDGDGLVDEGCNCTPTTTEDCWTGPPERRNQGACKDGKQVCNKYGEFTNWGPCVGEVLPQPEIPGNGIDEDCDGQDPGGPCVPSATYEDCSSGKDDDCNGLTDCADPACNSVCNCTQENCGDGVDNDCDYQVDCKDADCVGATQCQQVTGCVPIFPYFLEVACDNGIDDDCDGKIDCADPDCIRPGLCGCSGSETNCSDGKDEDCDKGADCADLDCQKCTPGSERYCDDPQYCHWGQQTCGSDGKWGVCTETTNLPGNCQGTLYSTDCCIQAGACCQNYPTDQTSVGNCTGTVSCL